MKREKLSTTESQMNNDALLPLVEDMLENRRQCIEEVNEMFGTEISVDFASSWEKLIEEMEAESNQLDSEGMQDGADAADGEQQTGTGTVGESDMADVRDAEEQRPDSDDDEEAAQGDETQVDASDAPAEERQEHMETADAGVEVIVDVDVNVGDEERSDEDESDGSVSDSESS